MVHNGRGYPACAACTGSIVLGAGVTNNSGLSDSRSQLDKPITGIINFLSLLLIGVEQGGKNGFKTTNSWEYILSKAGG